MRFNQNALPLCKNLFHHSSASSVVIILCILFSVVSYTSAFASPTKRVHITTWKSIQFDLKSTARSRDVGSRTIDFQKCCVLSESEVAPLVRLKKGSEKREKIINLFGIWTIFVTIITCPFWAIAMSTLDTYCKANPDFDPDRSLYDKTGKIWSRTWLALTNSYPSFSGDFERLKYDVSEYGSVLYVANHASWLDIPVLCTVLNPVFKFIAKGELKDVPCIGNQLIGGKHVLIDRDDRRSQLRTFKEGVKWLNNGMSLMAFPEGKRSPDGRLMEFKKGIFSMAIKSNVPIVPISISNTHAIMPANALFPVQSGEGKLHVHVHSPITVDGKDESELEELVRSSLLSKLPLDQQTYTPEKVSA
mmetsp:Transcript_1717/g.2468  ORF Transcript_1717/g.2468 Transcript_1717/m.2468 type:complete len:361 (+) Transcript_1717:3-1085(+)